MITSGTNGQIKNLIKLQKSGKYRKEQQMFVVEGLRIFKEIPKEWLIKAYVTEEFLQKQEELLKDVPLEVVAPNVLKEAADTKTPQGVIALVKMPNSSITSFLQKENPCFIVLENLQDPGNLGTLLRSAVAFGFDGVILGDGCVDVYNEKVIRSTQGAIFKIPIEFHSLKEYVPMLQANGVKVYGTSLENGQPLGEIEEDSQMAFILGNEGQGVNPELLSTTNRNIFIEMTQNIESLNVSIAGSIIMYRFRL